MLAAAGPLSKECNPLSNALKQGLICQALRARPCGQPPLANQLKEHISQEFIDPGPTLAAGHAAEELGSSAPWPETGELKDQHRLLSKAGNAADS